jgi:two-component system chemotaxis response regulator CheB
MAVLHRGEGGDEELIHCLQSASVFPVQEALDKEDLRPGIVYIAPSGYHLLLEKGALALSTEGPVSRARPSVDVLFESTADSCGKRATGGNSDGARGLARIKECGGLTIVQEPSEADCSRMPRAAIAASSIDHVLPLSKIAALLTHLCPELSKADHEN